MFPAILRPNSKSGRNLEGIWKEFWPGNILEGIPETIPETIWKHFCQNMISGRNSGNISEVFRKDSGRKNNYLGFVQLRKKERLSTFPEMSV